MKVNIAWIIFMVGIIPFLFAYYPVKRALESWQFLLLGISYVVILRLVSDYIAGKIRNRQQGEKSEQIK